MRTTLIITALLFSSTLLAEDCSSVLPRGVYDMFHSQASTTIEFRRYLESDRFVSEAESGEVDYTDLAAGFNINAGSARQFQERLKRISDESFNYYFSTLEHSVSVNSAAYEKFVDCLRGGISVKVQSVAPTQVEFQVLFWSTSPTGFPKIGQVTSSNGRHTPKVTPGEDYTMPRIFVVPRNDPYETVTLTVSSSLGEAKTAKVKGEVAPGNVHGKWDEIGELLEKVGAKGFRAVGLTYTAGEFKVTLQRTERKIDHDWASAKNEGSQKAYLAAHKEADGWITKSWANNAGTGYFVSSRETTVQPDWMEAAGAGPVAQR